MLVFDWLLGGYVVAIKGLLSGCYEDIGWPLRGSLLRAIEWLKGGYLGAIEWP